MQPNRTKEIAIAFLTAHLASDVEAATALCAPDYEITTFAPIGLFPHLGQKSGGKAWVAETIRTQDRRYSSRKFDVLNALGDDDQANVIASMRLTKRSDGRVVQFVSSHFYTFKLGLIAQERVMFDSFELVEQLLGQDLTGKFASQLKHAV